MILQVLTLNLSNLLLLLMLKAVVFGAGYIGHGYKGRELEDGNFEMHVYKSLIFIWILFVNDIATIDYIACNTNLLPRLFGIKARRICVAKFKIIITIVLNYNFNFRKYCIGGWDCISTWISNRWYLFVQSSLRRATYCERISQCSRNALANNEIDAAVCIQNIKEKL